MQVQTKAAQGRLEFLDFARAIAALAVALMHILAEWSPRFQRFTLDVFNPGVFGVVTFFLVSGFIIPFSLERLGSLWKFWVNRVFRLFPLYWMSLLGVMALYWLGVGAPPPDFLVGLRDNALWNITMVHFLFDVPSAIGLYWTLSYEMLFYAVMSALFVVGGHKKGHWIVMSGAALFTGWYALEPLYYHRVRFHVPYFWMFTFWIGTTLFRGWHGDESVATVRRTLLAFALAVTTAAVVNFGYLGVPHSQTGINPPAFLSAWVASYVFFGLLLYFRHAHFPRVLLWLGRISYSIYIVQGLMLQILFPVSPGALLVIRLAGTIALSALTYRLIEEPCIRLGKKLLSRSVLSGTPIGA
jgi:peptidoglycan/LPS O-acetylase OafA/YrhL